MSGPAPELESWLCTRSIQLRSTVPVADDSDLESWTRHWSDVTVVGLGESTHGTREFFTLKHRIVVFLAARMGLKIFAMEASESAAEAVDGYVRREGESVHPRIATATAELRSTATSLTA